MRDEIYTKWKKQRAEGMVPAGFSRRVMRQVYARQAEERTFVVWSVEVLGPIGRVAACGLAALMGMARMSQVMGVLVP
jgi:hypothetical protein